MDFSSLPDRPDHPRYAKRLRSIEHLLRQKPDRLVEEGMCMDAATAEADLWWFCKRFTPFATWKNDERRHPLAGQLWIDHPFIFWLCRWFQRALVDPPDGWVWFKIHRKGLKTTILLDAILWLLAQDESETIGLWTHKAEAIGTGMGRGLLAQLQTDELRDHWPQYRRLQEGTKQGFLVDRPPGPRDQSVSILSIATSTASLHPKRFFLDDVETDQTRNNPGMIATIDGNISAIALMQQPGSTFIVANTPWDESGPLMSRARDGGFAWIIEQTATSGGQVVENGEIVSGGFTAAGEPNLHTKAFYTKVRKETRNDPLYFAQMEFEFRKGGGQLFSREWIKEYDLRPEELAAAAPYIHILVDGAKGKKKSDFAIIRVVTWMSHECWATLDLIRERIGKSAIFQILLGRDETDPTSRWIEDWYCPKGVGVVERWMAYDRELTVWFDDGGNADWEGDFLESIRLRRVTFNGGRAPHIKVWPTVHRSRDATKILNIQDLDTHYQGGHAHYPRHSETPTGGWQGGFGHGSRNGLVGEDRRDTYKQFLEDEFDRMRLGDPPQFDDALDTEAQLTVPKFRDAMRRPRKDGGFSLNGVEYPQATVDNPFGVPGGVLTGQSNRTGTTWMSWA